MRLYRFYLQGKRYVEARQELLDALAKFPEQLAEQKALLFNLTMKWSSKCFKRLKSVVEAVSRSWSVNCSKLISRIAMPLTIQRQRVGARGGQPIRCVESQSGETGRTGR